MTSFVNFCLRNSSTTKITPLHCSFSYPTPTLCNPSICYADGEMYTNIRGVNYMLWNNENGTFDSICGPLLYITPNGYPKLLSENYIGKLNEEHVKIQWSSPDRWSFVGLEDIRLVYWEGKMYATGVRRDYWENGEGRMVLAEIDLDGNYRNEVVLDIEDEGFCEKNWMPIEDIPFHYVRWVNPFQIIRVDPRTGDCENVLYKEMPEHVYKDYDGCQMRGSSQVIRVNDYYVALIHLCRLDRNQKNEKCSCNYRHQFIVWDNDWNMVFLSKPFSFGDFDIEFTNGLAYKDGRFYIPFSLQDNMAWLLEIDDTLLEDYFKSVYHEIQRENCNLFETFFLNTKDSNVCVRMGDYFKGVNENSAAACLYGRACMYYTFSKDRYYDTMYKLGRSLASIHDCDTQELSIYLRMIDAQPSVSDGYHMVAQYSYWRENFKMSYTMCKLAMDKDVWRNVDSVENDILLLKSMYFTEDYEVVENFLIKLKNKCNEKQYKDVEQFLERIQKDKGNKCRIL